MTVVGQKHDREVKRYPHQSLFIVLQLLIKSYKVIHQARKYKKGRVTTCVARLHTMLKINEVTGTYDHDSFSKIELGEVEISLKEAWKNVQDLHESFQYTREEGANAAKENEIEKEQIDYIVTCLPSTPLDPRVDPGVHQGQPCLTPGLTLGSSRVDPA